MHTKNRQSKRPLQRNVNYMRWSRLEVGRHLMPKTWHANARLFYVLTLLPLVMLLPACVSNPPLPCKVPEPVAKPALSQPLPLQSYSISAASDIRTWGLRLTDTSPTSGSSLTPPKKD